MRYINISIGIWLYHMSTCEVQLIMQHTITASFVGNKFPYLVRPRAKLEARNGKVHTQSHTSNLSTSGCWRASAVDVWCRQHENRLYLLVSWDPVPVLNLALFSYRGDFGILYCSTAVPALCSLHIVIIYPIPDTMHIDRQSHVGVTC